MAFLFKSKKTASGLPQGSRKLASADGHHSQAESSQDLGDSPKPSAPVATNNPSRGVYSPTPELRNPRERSESSMSMQGRTQRPQHDLSLYPWSQHRLNFVQGGQNPFPRYGAAINSVASVEGDVYLMGGLIEGATVKGDLWMVEAGSSSLECYSVATHSEGGPGPRVGHASLLVGNAFIVFGGDTKMHETDILDDTLYLLNTTTKQWTQAAPAGPRPSGRYGHTLNIIGTKIYIFGGQVEGSFFNDLVAFDLNALQTQTARWEVLIPNATDDQISSGPPARTNHTVITWNEKLYLFGGTDGNNWFNDVWMYDPKTNSWTQQDCNGFIPSRREGHAAALVGDHMYVFGGRTEEGKDLGDLAAFRIPTRRWFTFQHMGPAPSPRSGHGMTAFGNQIIVLGGEPSSTPSEPKELSMGYVLDTSKIRYPPEHSAQKPSNSRKTSIGEKTNSGLPERSASREGHAASSGTRKISARGSEDSINSFSQQQQAAQQNSPPQQPSAAYRGADVAPNGNSFPVNGQVQRTGPRMSSAPGAPGPPPQEAAPQPRINGVNGTHGTAAVNGIKPSYGGQESRESPRMQQSQRLDRSQPQDQGSMPRENGANLSHQPSREVLPSHQISNNPYTQPRNTSQLPPSSTPVMQPEQQSVHHHSNQPFRTESQRSARQQGSLDASNKSIPKHTESNLRSIPQDAVLQTGNQPRQLPVDSGVGSSPALGQHNDDLLREMESIRSRNAWYASELALAKKAGYRSSATEASITDEKTINAFGEEEKPMLEALIRMKTELEKVQTTLETQSSAAAEKISLVEKQRDAAVAEAVYVRTRLAARDRKASGVDDEGRNTATPDQERSDDAQRRLASALTAQNELTSKLRALTKELENEKRTRQIAEESAETAHGRAAELDLYKQQSSSELERLRSELSQAQVSSREHAANHSEVASAQKMLEIEKNELSAKLNVYLNENRGNDKTLESVRTALAASTSRAATLEKKLQILEDERTIVEEKMLKLRNDHESRLTELSATTRQLQDTKDIAETYKIEAQSHREAVLAGLGKTRSPDLNSNSNNDERVIALQQRLEAANSLVRQNQEAADSATDRLRRAEERIAGLEAYQEQTSREGLTMRKQLQAASREALLLQSRNTELSDELSQIQLNTAAIEAQHTALRDLLNERGVDTTDLPARIAAADGQAAANAERLRDLEQQLESSVKAHEELRNSFEVREQEANKGWEERLAALDSDYQSAVKYFKVAETMVTKMKQESRRYKTQIKELEEALATERQNRSGLEDESSSTWTEERESLKNELKELQARHEESATQLEKQMQEVRNAQMERDTHRQASDRLQQELAKASETSHSDIQQLRQQNHILETRASEAERKLQMLLDTMATNENSATSKAEPGPRALQSGHQREISLNSIDEGSVYDANGSQANGNGASSELGRNSVAIDSLASELDALKSHWESTSRNYRFSDKSLLDDKSSHMDGLASWRKKLELDEQDETT